MKKFIYLITFFLLTLSACNVDNSIQNGNEENVKVETSMETVITMGMAEANNYYDNLQLTKAYSYDNDYEQNLNAGEDGKREWWYVNFANDRGNFVRVLIVDGEIEEIYNVDEEGNNGLIDILDITLTAEEAVKKSKEKGLRGGNPNNEEEWVSGFNFNLEYGSLVESPDKKVLLLDVIGISKNGNFARISFDAVSGELLLAMEQFEYEDGHIAWEPF